MSPGLLWAAAVTAGTRTDPAVTEELRGDLLMSGITDLTGEVRQTLFTEEGRVRSVTFSPQEPRNPKRKPWLAGTEAEREEQEEPPPASGDQEEEQQEEQEGEVEEATMDQAGELPRPKPLSQEEEGEDGATPPVVLVSSLPDLRSGARTRVLPWEGDLTTVGPVSGEPNLSQECPDLPEVSKTVSCID